MRWIFLNSNFRALVYIFLFIICTNVAIALDIPFLRPLLGFFFITTLPGLLMLDILKLSNLDFMWRGVLSIGLSISFLLIYGLFWNNLSISFGHNSPLAASPLMISFSLIYIAMSLVGYKLNKNKSFALPYLNLSASDKAILIVPILFPALSILGTNYMNSTDNNSILMLYLFLIPLLIVRILMSKRTFSNGAYFIIIFLISISLMLMLSTRSYHLIGADTNLEYSLFKSTLNNLQWSLFSHSVLDSSLSISLAPAIYSSILNLDPEVLFKILYSLIYSVTPLAVYLLSSKYLNNPYAFIASCFFMFQRIFLATSSNSRTCIAVMFIGLSFLILFNIYTNELQKRILFMIFMVSIILSHYTTAYIYIFMISGLWVARSLLSVKFKFDKSINIAIILLFLCLIYIWYSQITEAPFAHGVIFLKHVLIEFQNFFLIGSRGSDINLMLGKGILQKGIPQKIEFILTWLTFLYIAIGVLTIVRDFKKVCLIENGFPKPGYLRGKLDVEYFLISLFCIGLLILMIVFPYLSIGYGTERVYAICTTILSTSFVIGGIIISKYVMTIAGYFNNLFNINFINLSIFIKEIECNHKINQKQSHLIILLVLIPYFFCVTGMTYQAYGIPNAITLNSNGDSYDIYYIHDQETHASKWLANKIDENNTEIYTDFYGRYRLISQGMISSNNIIYDKSFAQYRNSTKDIYIYLSYVNTAKGMLLNNLYHWHNIKEHSSLFNKLDLIYDNDGSEFYMN